MATGTWIESWEAQQDQFMPDREERFQIMFKVVALLAGDGPMTVLDLGCGPGSLSIRLLRRFPSARVIGVDLDPVLLKIGREAYAGEPRLRFVTADLSAPGWTERLGLDEAPAAALSTTALHWLDLDGVTRLYGDLAGLLRPGGVLLDGTTPIFPLSHDSRTWHPAWPRSSGAGAPDRWSKGRPGRGGGRRSAPIPRSPPRSRSGSISSTAIIGAGERSTTRSTSAA